MKTATTSLVAFLLMTSLCAAEEVKVEQQIKYACILFDQILPSQFLFGQKLFDQKGQIAFEGALNAKQFYTWFKPRLTFSSGPIFVLPNDAAIFGALILTNGEERIAIPLYRWMDGKTEVFSCRSDSANFLVQTPGNLRKTSTRQDFLEEMKTKLIEISKEK